MFTFLVKSKKSLKKKSKKFKFSVKQTPAILNKILQMSQLLIQIPKILGKKSYFKPTW